MLEFLGEERECAFSFGAKIWPQRIFDPRILDWAIKLMIDTLRPYQKAFKFKNHILMLKFKNGMHIKDIC